MKKYLKGFLIGLLILFIFGLLLIILEQNKIIVDSLALVGNLIVPFYIFSVYKKDKQPGVWIIISLIVGFLALPFYLGAAEVSKIKKLK